MEKSPWVMNVKGPFLQWKGPVGIKEDGGGCTRGRGRVGPMVVHRAAASRDKEGEPADALLLAAPCSPLQANALCKQIVWILASSPALR
jgi:hypothetical protein